MSKKANTKAAQKTMSEIRQTYAEFDKEASNFLANNVESAAKRSRIHLAKLRVLFKQFRRDSIDAFK